MAHLLHVDGGARGNPGPAGAGVVLQTHDGDLVHEAAYFLGKQTNNFAEYSALIHGLERALREPVDVLTVHSDSELLVRQITGEYRVKSPKLQPLFEQAQMLLLKIPRWTIKHIPREENKRADELANRAMDSRTNEVVFDTAPDAAEQASGGARQAASDVGDTDGEQPGPTASADSAKPAAAPPAAADRTPVVLERGEVVVEVHLARRPQAGTCVLDEQWPTRFEVGAALPAGLCLHAAHALLPTIISLKQTSAADLQHVPTMTVRCTRKACQATFHILPLRATNGRPPASDA